MIKILYKRWFDLGGIFSVIIMLGLIFNYRQMNAYCILMWINLIALLIHQLEEYRIVGTFPGMVNTVMYKSDLPDRYPLNMKTAFFVNVLMGWTAYLLAAICSDRAIWLGLAVMLVSLGNTIAHTFVFNIKANTIYNAGLVTCWLLFVPCMAVFFYLVLHQHLMSFGDFVIGLIMGIGLNYLGILKLIEWMKDRNSIFVFPARCMLKAKTV